MYSEDSAIQPSNNWGLFVQMEIQFGVTPAMGFYHAQWGVEILTVGNNYEARQT